MPAVNSGRRVSEFAAAILERIHLLRDDIGGLADRAAEHFGLLEHRHFDPAEAVELAHPLEGLDDMRESLGLGAEDVLGAADGLWRLAHGRALSRASQCSEAGLFSRKGARRKEVAPDRRSFKTLRSA